MTNKKKKTKESEEEKRINDLTQERNERCFPVVKEVLQLLLDKDLLLSDRKYVEDQVKLGYRTLIDAIVFDHMQAFFDILHESLNRTIAAAQDKAWGKEVDKVSFKDVENVLNKE